MVKFQVHLIRIAALSLLAATSAYADVQYYATELLLPLPPCILPAEPCSVEPTAINDNGWVIGTYARTGIDESMVWYVGDGQESSTIGTAVPNPFSDDIDIDWSGIGIADNGDLLVSDAGNAPCVQGGGYYWSPLTVIFNPGFITGLPGLQGGGVPLNPNDCVYDNYAEELNPTEGLGGLSWGGPENSGGQYFGACPDGSGECVFTPTDMVPEPSSLWLLGTALILATGTRRIRKPRFDKSHVDI